MGVVICDGIVVFVSVVGIVGGDVVDLFVCWDLVEQIGQYWCIVDVVFCDFDGVDFQCFFVDFEVDFVLDVMFWVIMFVGVLFVFVFDFDFGVVCCLEGYCVVMF